MRFLLLFLLFAPLPLSSVDIGQLHKNDSNGLPAAPYSIGSKVTVEGTVTAGVGTFSSLEFDIYIQDETGGINVFAPNIPRVFRHGDKIRLTGMIQSIRGLTQLTNPTDMAPISFQNPMPEPILLTCQQVNDSFFEDYSEPHESRLVRLHNITIVEGSNNSYVISDGENQCIMVLESDIELPNGVFDVTGILKQNDDTEPFSDGYYIVPRFQSDIVQHTGPSFVQQPQEIDITPTSVTFQWRTQQPATAVFRYGQNGNLQVEIDLSESKELQEFVLDNLEPATIYNAQVTVVDALGSLDSKFFYFSTASDESSGRMHVFFNHSVNSSVKWLQTASGNIDLSTKIIQRINAAQHSLDIALYSFTHHDIYQAIFNAHSRGVKVRLIYDDDQNEDNNFITWLRDAGVPCISDAYGNNSGDAHMHNKFIVADYRDKSTGADDWVVGGSANFSYAGALHNAENLITINDEALAAAYTQEFEEMWGSNTDEPNAQHSRFGSNKLENTPHRFNINGVWVEQYMSPSDNTEMYLINAAHTADYTLDFCVLAFTRSTIANAFKERFYDVPGLMVRGVFDAGSKNTSNDIFDAMSGSGPYAWNPTADVHWDGTTGTLHHKYLLVDGSFRQSDPIVVTGSHNWSNNANFRNDENTLIIHDANIANLYYQEFVERYRDAGGKSDITVDVNQEIAPVGCELIKNYPNPFNNSTVIEFLAPDISKHVELFITDVLGRRVLSRSLPISNSEKQRFVWYATDSFDRNVASGIYTITLQRGTVSQSIKVLYLR